MASIMMMITLELIIIIVISILQRENDSTRHDGAVFLGDSLEDLEGLMGAQNL